MLWACGINLEIDTAACSKKRKNWGKELHTILIGLVEELKSGEHPRPMSLPSASCFLNTQRLPTCTLQFCIVGEGLHIQQCKR